MTERARAVIERARAIGVTAESVQSLIQHGRLVEAVRSGVTRTVAECEAWLDGHEAGFNAAVEIAVVLADG